VPTSSTTGHPAVSAGVVSLVAADARLRVECLTAARSVGFAVPCPTRVPTRQGRPLDCSPLPVPSPFPLCVGLSHDFFIEWTGFDVPKDFVGVDGRPAGHVIIHAAPMRDDPAVPCIDATRVSAVTVEASSAVVYHCPPDSPRIERLARHGEGAYAGHLTLVWREHGIVYLVSSHGYGTASESLLIRLARAVDLVAP
jgi:hypothetical protein